MSTPDTEKETKRFITIPKGYLDDLDLKIEVPECPYCEIEREMKSTPDTEEENELDTIYTKAIFEVNDVLKKALDESISSRDTYWKERVKQVSYEIVKEFQDSLITIAIKNEHMRGCVTSNQIIQAFKDFEASTHPILDITNEDNLK